MSHVDGVDDGVGYGVRGRSNNRDGVFGSSELDTGVHGEGGHDCNGVVMRIHSRQWTSK
jgi:hypothetical protein